MSFVTLVRHGQANTHARDEVSYDKLSELGWQQARWLGEHFRQTGEVFARVYTGTLRRHVETAEGIDAESPAPILRDERLNEFTYWDLAHAYHDQHGVALPDGREEFVTHLPRMLGAWRDGILEGVPETFDHFENRVREALTEISGGQGRALVVTSGGLIGMSMRLVLDLDMRGLAHMCLSVENTSLHRVQPLATGLAVTQFNATPHLDTAERQHARSHL